MIFYSIHTLLTTTQIKVSNISNIPVGSFEPHSQETTLIETTTILIFIKFEYF